MADLVSIVIPTHSGPNPRTLESIRGQTYQNIEVVIVAVGNERSSQMNKGARRAKGNYLYRVDDDFVLEPIVVEQAMKKCKEGYDAVYIHNTSDPSVSKWAKVRKIERDCFRDDDESSFARFVSRKAFFAVGGYDPRLIAEEDRDFNQKLKDAGFRIGRIEAKELHLGEPRHLSEVVRKHIYYGGSFGVYLTIYGPKALFKLGPMRRAYLRHWREILPIAPQFLLYQFVRYISALFGLWSKGSPSIYPTALKGGKGRTYGSVIVGRALSEITLKIPGSIIVAGTPSLNECRNLGAAGFPDKDFIAFIDDDNILASDALNEMAKALALDDRIGAVSPLIYDRDNRVWFAGVRWTSFGMVAINHTIPKNYRWTEAFHDVFMVKREAFQKVGGFDDERFPFYLGEADLAERMKKAGYVFVVAPKAHVWHDISGTVSLRNLTRVSHLGSKRRAYLVAKNRILFLRLHKGTGHFLFHLITIFPFLVGIHTIGIIYRKQVEMLVPYYTGLKDGLVGPK